MPPSNNEEDQQPDRKPQPHHDAGDPGRQGVLNMLGRLMLMYATLSRGNSELHGAILDLAERLATRPRAVVIERDLIDYAGINAVYNQVRRISPAPAPDPREVN